MNSSKKSNINMYKREVSEDWDFKNANTKEFTHCYHNYPAMMIPQIARKLLKEYAPFGKLELVFDPYMGSGTTLVESQLLSINSIGTDLNPLARLLSKVKTTDYDIIELKKAFKNIQDGLTVYSEDKVLNKDFAHITNADFWYSSENIYKLSYLTQLINSIDCRYNDFFRVGLAEIIREVSFTRNGEFKRFKMTEEKINKFNPNPFKLFEDKITRNLSGLSDFHKIITKSQASIYDFNSSIDIPSDIIADETVDLVVTSPPYGDSKTTVAYGQYSRWANEWFGFDNAKNLDSILMGGKVYKDTDFETESIKSELDQIKELCYQRYLDVAAFLDDYHNSIRNVAKKIRKGGRICYVVGNRNVKGVQISLDYFTAEMFEKYGFKHEKTIIRIIPNKRMPNKTSPSNVSGKKVNTMNNEYIVIMTKQ